jgi:hypothetical protein
MTWMSNEGEKRPTKLASKSWRLSHLYKIVDKNSQTITFKRNNAQEKLNAYIKELKEKN